MNQQVSEQHPQYDDNRYPCIVLVSDVSLRCVCFVVYSMMLFDYGCNFSCFFLPFLLVIIPILLSSFLLLLSFCILEGNGDDDDLLDLMDKNKTDDYD